MPSNQLECIFDALPDSVIVCDCEGKILRLNAAALKLFEVASEAHCRGTLYQQFLHHYQMDEEQQRALSLDPWLKSLVIGEEAACNPQEKTIVLQGPSGRKVYVNICCLPMLDTQKHAAGTVHVFYDITLRYQKARHVQRVYQAVLTLKEAISYIPEHLDLASPEVPYLLSPA